MKLLIQRVNRASVSVNNETVSEIKCGMLVFVGLCVSDNEDCISKASEKIINLRIFSDENGKMNKNITDIAGSVLLVSQFTLCSDLRSGNRPSFDFALEWGKAKLIFDKFAESLEKKVITKKGVFGEHMVVSLENDGPATFFMEF